METKNWTSAYRLKHYDLSIKKHTGPSGVLAVKLTDSFDKADVWSFGSDWLVLFSSYKRKKFIKKLDLKPLFAPISFESYKFSKICFATFSDNNLLHITTACGHLVSVNIITPSVEAVVRLHDDIVTGMKLCSSNRILTTGVDGTLVVYSPTEKTVKLVADLSLPVSSFDYSVSRNQVFVLSMSNVVNIYSVVDDFKVGQAENSDPTVEAHIHCNWIACHAHQNL